MFFKWSKIRVISSAVFLVSMSLMGIGAIACVDTPSTAIVLNVDADNLGAVLFQASYVAMTDIPEPQSPDQEPKKMIAFFGGRKASSL